MVLDNGIIHSSTIVLAFQDLEAIGINIMPKINTSIGPIGARLSEE
jgi:hypothetical protein